MIDGIGSGRLPKSVRRGILGAVLVGCLASGVLAPVAQAAPEVDLHELTWFVHADLINPGLGEDLAYWQGVIDDSIASANLLIEGRQGPTDEPCCARLSRTATVTTFGNIGDGFDIIDSSGEESALNGIGGSGSRAFLVDSVTYCGGSAPGSIGCAIRPQCDGDGADNPDLWMTVTVDALDNGNLSSVVGHERGHNSCLPHISTAKCSIMQATVLTPGQGGCVSVGECANYESARTQASSGLECGCHDDVGGLLADGSICTDVANGVCSGGVCGDITGDASVFVLAAADPGDGALGPEDLIRISGLGGDWTNLGQIGSNAEDIRALAFATDSNTLYGVVPSVSDDSLIAIDPATGAQIGPVLGTIANGSDEIISMAYDPGDTSASSDDRLLVLEAGASSLELRAIDPATPSEATFLGQLLIGPANAFTGMAYDSIQDRLFVATPFGPIGFFEIDLGSCSPCNISQLTSWAPAAFRNDASLAYSAETGMLYLAGTLYGSPDTRTFYTVVDPTTGTVFDTLSLDRFTPAGLAAVPEPGIVMGVTAGILGLTLTARANNRRERRSASFHL